MPWLLAIGLLISPRTIAKNNSQNQWIVWNVGQGLWVTRVENARCLHFDGGGEFNPIRNIKKICQDRKNLFLVSHWDQDHWKFLPMAFQNLKNSCLFSEPEFDHRGERHKQLRNLKRCDEKTKSQPTNIQTIFKGRPKGKTNSFSQVFKMNDWLLPGDSTKSEEKLWLQNLKIKTIKFLVLGHHGSQTSTGKTLLRNLPNLHTAIASAQKSVYGHPHKMVIENLRQSHTALLRTEDWGHIHFLE